MNRTNMCMGNVMNYERLNSVDFFFDTHVGISRLAEVCGYCRIGDPTKTILDVLISI